MSFQFSLVALALALQIENLQRACNEKSKYNFIGDIEFRIEIEF